MLSDNSIPTVYGGTASVGIVFGENARHIKREDIAKYYIVPERKEAIKQAILLLKDGDCLVVAGKGNECFIEIKV